MPRYRIKLNVVMMGVDTVEIDHPDELAVGQTVTVSPTGPITIGGQGGSVSMGPGVSISGSVIAKF